MIDPQISEWISQILRWLHVITAIAWIGSSFYFIHLDLSLKKRDGLPPASAARPGRSMAAASTTCANIWSRRRRCPSELTWFKWESYATWISGFFLLVVVYYLRRRPVPDRSARAAMLAPWQAVAIGIGGAGVGWLVYEACAARRSAENDTLLLGCVLFVYSCCWPVRLHALFSGRAAFLHTGAMIATMMSANVFMVIIPNQKKVVADLIAGRKPDPALRQASAKQRSLHNNYLTLPVLFLMLSNHYPLAFGTALELG